MAGPWEKYKKAEPAAEGPWSKYKKAPEPESRAGKAALQGFGESATLGYLPRIQAAVEPVAATIGDLITGQNVAENLPDYEQRREEFQKRAAQLAKQEPGAYAGGVIGGALATPGIGAAKALKGGSALGRITKAAGIGAGTGAAYDPGKGDVGSPEDLQERVKQAAVGAGTAGALRGGTEGLKQLLRPAQFLSRYAAGMRRPEAKTYARDYRKVGKIRELAEQGKEALGEAQAKRVGARGLQAIKKSIRETGQELDRVLEGKMVEVPGRGRMDALAANRLRRSLDKKARYKPGRLYSDEAAAKLDEFKQEADVIRRAISEQIDKARPLNRRMAEAYKVQNYLVPKVGGDDPAQLFRSTAEKDLAALQRAERLGAEGLVDYSRLRSAAKATDPLGGGFLGLLGAVARTAGQGGIIATDRAQRGLDKVTGEDLVRIMEELNRGQGDGAK